ncbi:MULTISPECIES: hypothetical protein [unclassified Methylosinus]|uniref:hypothetical protein n=1 Tax=unclassified Methylosinus TaxID=2624500 RepID=UPI0004665C8C|nr:MULTISPECIES: hypothetical protein [unclassified Methylosinus]
MSAPRKRALTRPPSGKERVALLKRADFLGVQSPQVKAEFQSLLARLDTGEVSPAYLWDHIEFIERREKFRRATSNLDEPARKLFEQHDAGEISGSDLWWLLGED